MTERVALVGAGVIGAGWAVQLLGRGHEVAVFDPSPDAVAAVRAMVEQARPAIDRMGLGLEGWESRLSVAPSAALVVAGATWVQESGPERPDLKARLLAELDDLAEPDVVIASSSSGISPSRLASWCERSPERVIVGHPFNPVHLIPLVEVVAAPGVAAATVERALAFYRSLGKRPIHVRREVPGHLANRLQAALWREAYSLVERGVATVADVDAAIAHGPGLRWALLGPLVNQHLSGGAGGLAQVLEHLGPPAQEWMDDLGDVRLTPELAAALVAGVDAELAGLDQVALAARRDRLLVDLLAAKAAAPELP
ncbi:3-hydroxyacyl-CoA dehydrogenase NAD-binding domain-containing protein [Nocardioides hungaricus]